MRLPRTGSQHVSLARLFSRNDGSSIVRVTSRDPRSDSAGRSPEMTIGDLPDALALGGLKLLESAAIGVDSLRFRNAATRCYHDYSLLHLVRHKL